MRERELDRMKQEIMGILVPIIMNIIRRRATVRLFSQTSSCAFSVRSSDEPCLTGCAPSARMPSEAKGAVWERMAVAVKLVEQDTSPYIETIRAKHDPALHIKTVEDELKSTIGKALGRQGEKLLRAMRLMEQEFKNHNSLLARHSSDSQNPEVIESARTCNEYRSQALEARWELTVHRQAIGFIVNNHNYVTEQYPIGPALPVPDKSPPPNEKASSHRNSTLLNDQFSWWERVGRWR